VLSDAKGYVNDDFINRHYHNFSGACLNKTCLVCRMELAYQNQVNSFKSDFTHLKLHVESLNSFLPALERSFLVSRDLLELARQISERSQLLASSVDLETVNFPEPPPLVGIELNPGPKKKGGGIPNAPKIGKKLKKAMKSLTTSKPSPARIPQTTQMKGSSLSVQRTIAPLTVGYVAPRSHFSSGGKPMAGAVQDNTDGIKCKGCAMITQALSLNSSATTLAYGVYGGFGGIGQDRGYQPLSPNNIDPRLAALAQCYQYYAFRKLELTYVPMIGSSMVQATNQISSNSTLYVAIQKDYEAAVSKYTVITGGTGGSAASGGTLQTVLDTDPAFACSVWQPASLLFTHFGAELWETFPNSVETVNQRIQCALVAVLETVLGNSTTGAVTNPFGRFWVTYEIDFYVPGPPNASN